MASLFEADIASLKGVGPKRAELFRKLGAPTVGDLLRLYPRAYEDWRDAVPIRNTLLNEVNIVKGTVLRRPVEQRIRGGMTLYKTTITDGEDDMQLTFFNNRYITSLLTEGAVYAFRGKVTGTFMRREMASPEFVPESRMQDMVPVYPQTSGLTSRIIANAVKEALRLLASPEIRAVPPRIRAQNDPLSEFARSAFHGAQTTRVRGTARLAARHGGNPPRRCARKSVSAQKGLYKRVCRPAPLHDDRRTAACRAGRHPRHAGSAPDEPPHSGRCRQR